MKRIFALLVVVVVLAGGYAFLNGYWRSSNPATPNSQFNIAGTESSELSRMTKVDWETELDGSTYPCLKISEAEFSELSRADRNELQQGAINLLQVLKPAVFWYVEQSQKLLNENPAKSQAYVNNAHAITQKLLEPGRLKILRDAGTSYQSILDNPQQLSGR